ncbi:aminotransferase, putative [Talaromyces stipitatus ATCC 10500]|uniref:Aminotransferase, putative n=1 Tax=Talaromyces stipitatus (strain ATCC 10500 / CBS 375.48 / QM 6759 / NRRL 1006) TaxID=441959 RepID=B8MGH0_TALSN|nr:aminotransferase, putative [Talaromyces stipitatus ATCC 10500]EED16290.1 aminotransferase, putative [Talaromyces stipitatus ATCC 10500]
MVKIEPFAVEQWMDDHETTATYNIAETCCASISLDDLQNLSTQQPDPNNQNSIFSFSRSTKLAYGAIRGSEQLRGHLSRLYSIKTSTPLPADNVLITSGAIQGNFLLHHALVGPGDHVIVHYPTYQQLYSVVEAIGAEVSLWKAKEDDENGWVLDTEELKGLIRPNTKLIVLNNPQNPTGAIIPKSKLEEIVNIARSQSIIIHADEVYRPIFHGISPVDAEFPPSLLSLGYKNAVVTGSMSKAYSLAGIRVGWIASRNKEIIDRCMVFRDYTTISVSQIDDAVASFALAPHTIHSLLHRNIQLAKTNLAILEKFIESHRWACDWKKPLAGTTAFVRFSKMGRPVDDVAFCTLLHEKTGVLVVPGSRCFGRDGDFKGYVRIGYVSETEVLEKGLEKLREFMKGEYVDDVPLAR